MADMIEIKHLNKYFGDLHVLKDINLTVKRGEKLVMIGPSGSGKSTLIRCVDYLEEPTSGEVVIDGTPLTKKNHLEMARKYSSMVFQQFNLYPNMTVLGNLTLAPIKLQKKSKEEATEIAIAALKRAGVRKTVMLTGDIRKVADHVAQELGIDEAHAELLPGDKVARLERLLGEKGKDDCLAFVGDGINDAPVLSRADIGIAMGAMGSDAAIEAADIVLMDDEPLQIAKAIKISRKCIGIVYQNIVFALVVKFALSLIHI